MFRERRAMRSEFFAKRNDERNSIYVMHRLQSDERPDDEFLVGKIPEQKICSLHRDLRNDTDGDRSPLSPVNSEVQGGEPVLRLIKGEQKMKKTILTIAGSALIALSTVQLAAAASERQNRVHNRSSAAVTQFRNSNAYAEPAYGAAQPEAYRYSGGISAPAGH